MSDWTEILKERPSQATLPLPEDDWEWFEREFRRRKRQRILKRSIIGAALSAAAAAIAVAVLHKPAIEEPIHLAPLTAYAGEVSETFPSEMPQMTAIGTAVHRKKAVASGIMIADMAEETEGAKDTGGTSPETEVRASDKPEEIQLGMDNPVGNCDYSGYWKEEINQRRHPVTLSPFIRRSGISGTNESNDATIIDFVYGADGPDDGHEFVHYLHENDYSHFIPVSFGLDVSIALNPRMSLTTGAEVSLYSSKCSSLRHSYTQRAYYFGIPLRIDWIVWENGPVSAWLGVGGKVDRLIYGKMGSERLKDDSFNWSLTGDLGIQYEIIPNVGLFLEPEVSYYFKPGNPAFLTYRTENPLMFSIGAGLRLTL